MSDQRPILGRTQAISMALERYRYNVFLTRVRPLNERLAPTPSVPLLCHKVYRVEDKDQNTPASSNGLSLVL